MFQSFAKIMVSTYIILFFLSSFDVLQFGQLMPGVQNLLVHSSIAAGKYNSFVEIHENEGDKKHELEWNT